MSGLVESGANMITGATDAVSSAFGLSDALQGPNAPQPPNMQALLNQQAQLNRINQTTPFGSLTYQGPNNTEAVIELDPQTQQTVDALQSTAAQRAQQLPGTSFDPSIPSVGGTEGGSLGPFDQSTQTQQAVFEQARNLLEPQFERQEEDLRQTLANQGLPAGGEAFSDQFNQFQRNRNRAFEDAAFQAVQQGNQRQNQLFEQGLAGLGAQQQVRNQNLNEVQALMSGQQVQGGQPGSFFGPSQIDVTGPASMQQQGQMAQFQSDQQRQQAMLGGLSSLGSAAIFASDRRLKRQIHKIGDRAGLPLYVFRYIWGEWQIGHMADEVAQLYPSAVLSDRNGFLMVDYGQIYG